MNQIYEYKVTKASCYNYEYETNFQSLLDKYAKEGWKLKSTIIVNESSLQETIFIFERYHPDYKSYNDELIKYVTEAK